MAARRFWLPWSTAAEVTNTLAAGWTASRSNVYFLDPATEPGGTLAGAASVATTNGNYGLNRSYISERLPAQTLSGNITVAIRGGSQASGAPTHRLAIRVQLINSTGVTTKSTLVALTTSGGTYPTLPTVGELSVTAALPGTVVAAGDRIRVEIGVQVASGAGSTTATQNFGSLASDADTPTGGRPYVEFSVDPYAFPTFAQAAGVGAELIRSRTANPAQLAGVGAEVLRTRTATPAQVAAIGLEVLRPVAVKTVSLHDLRTPIEVKHSDGVWRPVTILGAG